MISDREDAIRTALMAAQKGDVVLLAGKGSEGVQVTQKGPVKWKDTDVATRILAEIEGNML